VVQRLGLTPLSLVKPLLVTLAFDGSSDAKPFFLSMYVEFTLSSANSSWSSRSCKAIVVPSLCADFILGLPFLSFNKIVVDCHTRIVILGLLFIHPPTSISLTTVLLLNITKTGNSRL